MFLQKYNTETRTIEHKEPLEIEYGWSFKLLGAIKQEHDLYFLIFEWAFDKSWELFVPVSETIYNAYKTNMGGN